MIESTVGDRVDFDIDLITIGKRKRDLGDITALSQSISEVGLLHPIIILPNGTLVSGYHRLESCKFLRWRKIPVIIRDWEDLHAELAEIDENIVRNELKEIEKARHFQRRKEIYEALHPETKKGAKGGWHNVKTDKLESAESALSSSFAEDTARKTGKSKRTIQVNTQIAKNISSDLDSAILSSPLADNQTELLKLARMKPEQQKAIVDTITNNPDKVKNVRQATVALNRKKAQEGTIQIENVSSEIHQIYHCPVSELQSHVTEGSLDAIITDPPYPREYLSVYTDLAKFAAYALKPGGSLIAMVGQSYLPDIMNMLREHLTYHWLSCYYVPGYTAKIWPRHIGASWKPLLWFVKGEYTGQWVKDVIRVEAEDIFIGKQKDKKYHEWGQPESDMVNIIEHFTQPGQLICDPFLGGGTTAVAALASNRRFIGCDIDQQCVQKSIQRINGMPIAV